MSGGTAALIIILVIVVIVLLVLCLRTVRPTHRVLIERFGKYNRFANPGLVFLIPFVETLVRVNITEQMVSSEKREIITLDSLNAVVDSNVYFKVKSDENSVKFAIYAVNNYREQIIALAKTTLRNIIGTMTLKEANSDRNRINTSLYAHLSKETLSWGIEIVRTELKEIQPPETVQKAMNQVVIAENEKRSAIDFATAKETQADGEKRALIKNAEGAKQSAILKAEGEKEAKILVADGEAEAIRRVSEASNKYFLGNAQILRKLQAVETTMAHGSKIVIPAGQSLVNVIGDLADIKEGK